MLPKNLWTMSENRRKSPETLMNPDESRAITIKLLAILPLPCRSRAAPVPLPCRSTARHTHTHKNQNRSLLTKSGNLFHRILRADARGGCSRRIPPPTLLWTGGGGAVISTAQWGKRRATPSKTQAGPKSKEPRQICK